jgi:uncharacterized repeat protein (TIGR04042 family)
LIVKDYFRPGDRYAMPEFLQRIREATGIASARVEAKYGYPCPRAHGQLAEIERRANAFADDPLSVITVLTFQDLQS